MKRCLMISLLAVFFGAGVVTARAADMPVEAKILLNTSESWDGAAYERYPAGTPELTVLQLVIAPNIALPWHQHPMPNVAYVVSGELLVEKQEGGAKKRLVAGDVLPEMVNSVHRGVTGESGVILIVFYAGVKGMKLSE